MFAPNGSAKPIYKKSRNDTYATGRLYLKIKPFVMLIHFVM
ncbi:hypothetical protein FHR29_002993 [Sphingobacterium sp. JUb56]|nr:hypothetical protein [Sphingobacterium sp. JUb56]